MPTISYAICVHNEHAELARLLSQLVPALAVDDEIVVQGDQGKVTDEVVSVLHKFRKNAQVKYVEYPLNRDFASYKNNLFKNCTKNWIFQIDADELVADHLLHNLKFVLSENDGCQMFRVPRINMVTGLTDEWVKRWGWVVNEHGWVNFPDRQQRIVANNGKIRWTNKVHEILSGYESWADLPGTSDYALFHVKSIDRQIKQNEFYATI